MTFSITFAPPGYICDIAACLFITPSIFSPSAIAAAASSGARDCGRGAVGAGFGGLGMGSGGQVQSSHGTAHCRLGDGRNSSCLTWFWRKPTMVRRRA